jgi:hypothetical protein
LLEYILSFTLAHLLYRSLHGAAPRNGAACLDKVMVSLPRQQSYTNQDTVLPARFNWRLRALSRITRDEKKNEKGFSYLKRLRPISTGADLGKPFYDAIGQYSEKYVASLSCLGY